MPMALMSHRSQELQIDSLPVRIVQRFPGDLTGMAIFTLGFYIVDAWVLNLPLFSFILFLLILPIFLISTVGCVCWRLRPSAVNVMASMGILFLGIVAVVGTRHIRRTLFQYRVTKMGDVCLAYGAKYHYYPERLNDIVPEFISSIPKINVGILGDEDFGYSSHDGAEPFIYYNCLPPFGHCY